MMTATTIIMNDAIRDWYYILNIYVKVFVPFIQARNCGEVI